ncbi:MAG TPA: shikimate dehydrogenase [Steroidobacteraceae bacterium]|jgi:shikimate dehydrogenase|nr:shikimate dehydrogenase [Steroidobacteraceae bacterium]
MPAPERYAVIGHPISHSLSPRIHTLFAAQCGRALRYEAIDVLPEQLATTVHSFFANGGRGLNVTLPHKQAVMGLLSRCSEAASRARAVNTLWSEPAGGLVGDNTDGLGLVRDLQQNLGVSVAARRLLLLGAGGAARGVLGPLLALGPRELVLANRDAARAQALAAEYGPQVRACALTALAAGGGSAVAGFDLLLNATAASLSDELPALSPALLQAGTVCYDLAYALHETAFVAWARRAGAAAAYDGLGMLVEQAAESFQRWHGVRPDTAAVLRALRADMPSRARPQ